MKIHAPEFRVNDKTAHLWEVRASALLPDGSSDSTVELTIPGDVDNVLVDLQHITLNDAVNLWFRLSFDGVTFESGTNYYEYNGYRVENTSSSVISSTGNTRVILTNGTQMPTTDGKAMTGQVIFRSLGDLNTFPQFEIWLMYTDDAGDRQTAVYSGHLDKASRPGTGFGRVKAIQFGIDSSGTFESGAWKVLAA